MIRCSHVTFMSEMPGVYPFSGLENHLMALLPALHRQGVDVELIVLTWGVGQEMTARLDALREQGIVVTIQPCNPARQWRWLNIRRLEQAAHLRALFAPRQDRIIHLHTDLTLALITLWTMRVKRACFTIHNDDPWLTNSSWRARLRLLNRRLAYVIAISERVRQHFLSASGISPDKVTRIYYGVAIPKAKLNAAELRRAHHIPPDRFVVGYVGRLSAQKNIGVLIAAMRQLPDAHCVVIGDGELREELQMLARDLNNVQFLGRQPNGADLMPAFDVMCLPSHFEGLGLVLVEAMLQRVPVIGSCGGAIPEILGDGEYGLLFEPKDCAGLVAAIQSAQRDRIALRAMTERAFDYARRTFSVEAMAQQTRAVYERMLRV